MMEVFTLLLLFGAVLYHSLGLSLIIILIISTLAGAFFFSYFLSKGALLVGCFIGVTIMLGACTAWYHTAFTPGTIFGDHTLKAKIESVDRRLDNTILIVQEQPANVLLQVTTSDNELLPGDVISIKGTIQQPQDFMTSTGRIFPYQHYLASKHIVGTITNPAISLVAKGHFSLSRVATAIRFAIANSYTNYISFPIDGIVAGMTVGYQGGIPQDIQDLFRTTGVLHVLVLSGENITLLAVFLAVILQSLPFRVRLLITAIAIVLIVCISGAGVSAVRAGIMGSIALLAGLTKRSYMPLRALTISVLFFFFSSPETIFSDPGFHLSVLATIFMIVVLPKVSPYFSFLPQRFHIRELSILAICVPLFMLPYTMYFSGLLSAASPFANILMAILTPFFMIGGAVILAVSWMSPIASVAGAIVSFVGANTIAVLKALNTLPQLNTPPLAWWGVVVLYLAFFTVFFRMEFKQFWLDLKNVFLPQTNSSEPRSQ